jgi:hypothetical protein
MQYTITDPVHQEMIVAAFEHPPTWRRQSHVVWNFQNTSQPVVIYGATWNPNGVEAFEFLPVEGCYWLEPNYGFQAVGQQRFGLTLLPPMPAAEMMTQWLIPKYRNNRLNLRLVGVQPIPNLAQMLNAVELQNMQTEGVAARVEYLENGYRFEEEFYACRYQFPPAYGAVTQHNWGLVRVFCFRTAHGQLDNQRQRFWNIATSLFHNPQWQELFHQITQQLHGQFVGQIQAGYDKLRSEAHFQQQLTAYYQGQRDQQNATIAQGIERQKDANAARSSGGYTAQDAWGDGALLNRTAYEDPNSQHGNYHYDYGHHDWVWTDGQGNFVPTNDPNYDPNLGSDRSWTLAKKAR